MDALALIAEGRTGRVPQDRPRRSAPKSRLRARTRKVSPSGWRHSASTWSTSPFGPAVPGTGTVGELFEAQVRRDPTAPAVVSGDVAWSFGELNAYANRLARLLVSRGVGPETLVALVLPRRVETLAAVLAVHKTGGAYLPLDPTYPAERIRDTVADAAPALVLCTADVVLPDLAREVLTLDSLDLDGLDPADLTDADRRGPLDPDHRRTSSTPPAPPAGPRVWWSSSGRW